MQAHLESLRSTRFTLEEAYNEPWNIQQSAQSFQTITDHHHLLSLSLSIFAHARCGLSY